METVSIMVAARDIGSVPRERGGLAQPQPEANPPEQDGFRAPGRGLGRDGF